MIKKLLVTLFISFNVNALDLFKADYTVYKDGKKIGKSSIELNKENSKYTITDKTNGTHGMASFLGFKRSEVTEFTTNNGVLTPLSYKMKQKVAFNKRQSDYKIDTTKHSAKGKYKDDAWETKIPKLTLTPNLVSLSLFQDICAGKTKDLNYQVLKRGKVQNYKFSITSQKDGVIEVDKIHSKPSRVTKTWLDTNQHCIPVKTYHKEKGEDALESRLVSVDFKNT